MGILRILSLILLILGIILSVLGFTHMIPLGGTYVSTHNDNSAITTHEFTIDIPAAPIFLIHSTTIELIFANAAGTYEVSVYFISASNEGLAIPTKYNSVIVTDGTFKCTFDEFTDSTSDHKYNYTVSSSGTFSFEERISFALLSPLLIGAPLAIIGLIFLVISLLKGREKAPKIKPTTYYPEPTMDYGRRQQQQQQQSKASSRKQKVKKSKATSRATSRATARPQAIKKPAQAKMISCKFCGNFVPGDSYYCPKCYGKLR